MSYARFSKTSSVYVYLDERGYLRCCACSLGEAERFTSTEAMIEHLRRHTACGDRVPNHAIPGLERDRIENDEFIRAAAT